MVSYGASSSGAEGFVDLYVDFHFVESAALPGPAADLRSLRIGASTGDESAAGLHGMVEGVQIFDRSVTALAGGGAAEVCDASAAGLLGWCVRRPPSTFPAGGASLNRVCWVQVGRGGEGSAARDGSVARWWARDAG